MVSSLELRVYGNDYKLYYLDSSQEVRLNVNGINHNVPYLDEKYGVTVIGNNTGMQIKTLFGLEINFNKPINAYSPGSYVHLPDAYANQVCGLCGNFNGNPDDDFVDRNNNPVPIDTTTDYEQMRYNWGSKWRGGVNFGKDVFGES